MVRGEINDRSRRHADVDDIRAAMVRPSASAATRSGPEGGRRGRPRRSRRRGCGRACRSARPISRTTAGVRLRATTPRISGAEDFGRDVHSAKNASRRCGNHAGRPGKPTWPPVRGNSSTTLGDAPASRRAARPPAGMDRARIGHQVGANAPEPGRTPGTRPIVVNIAIAVQRAVTRLSNSRKLVAARTRSPSKIPENASVWRGISESAW